MTGELEAVLMELNITGVGQEIYITVKKKIDYLRRQEDEDGGRRIPLVVLKGSGDDKKMSVSGVPHLLMPWKSNALAFNKGWSRQAVKVEVEGIKM